MAELLEVEASVGPQVVVSGMVASEFSTAVPALPTAARRLLGEQLRAIFGVLAFEALPPALMLLIEQIEATGDGAKASEDAFRQDVLAAVPALRGFAHSLAPQNSDDLVQETLLKAWMSRERFQTGTNIKAWLFTILRNHFYSQIRKRKREVEDADGLAAAQLVALPSQEHEIDLQKVWNLVAKLPATQRESLMLVSAQGMTYEAAAEILGCQVGTVKSRVSRARTALTKTLEASGALCLVGRQAASNSA